MNAGLNDFFVRAVATNRFETFSSRASAFNSSPLSIPRTAAVNGRDLLDIVKEDLLVHLGVTFSQAKKIKMELQALTSANTAQMQRAFPGSGQMHMLPPKGASGHLPPLAVEPPEEVKSPFDTPSDVNLVPMAYPVGNSASGGFQAPVPSGKIEYTSHQENSRTNSAIRNENTAAATGDTGIECGPQKIL